MMGRIENPQFDNTTFPMMERFDKEINEQLENKLERLKNISELTSVNFKKNLVLNLIPMLYLILPINRKTQDLIITKGRNFRRKNQKKCREYN